MSVTSRLRLDPAGPRARHYPPAMIEVARIDVLEDGRAQFFVGEPAPLVEAATLPRLLESLCFTNDDLVVTDVPKERALPEVG